MKDNKEKQVGGIVSLVLGIISVLTTLFWYMSVPTGITSIIMGIKAYKKLGSKLGMAGFILGIVGLAFTIFIYITLIIIMILGNLY